MFLLILIYIGASGQMLLKFLEEKIATSLTGKQFGDNCFNRGMSNFNKKEDITETTYKSVVTTEELLL